MDALGARSFLSARQESPWLLCGIMNRESKCFRGSISRFRASCQGPVKCHAGGGALQGYSECRKASEAVDSRGCLGWVSAHGGGSPLVATGQDVDPAQRGKNQLPSVTYPSIFSFNACTISSDSACPPRRISHAVTPETSPVPVNLVFWLRASKVQVRVNLVSRILFP